MITILHFPKPVEPENVVVYSTGPLVLKSMLMLFFLGNVTSTYGHRQIGMVWFSFSYLFPRLSSCVSVLVGKSHFALLFFFRTVVAVVVVVVSILCVENP